MRKGLHKKALAGFLAAAMVVSGSGISALGNDVSASAEEATNLNKILGAEDLADLKMKWNDTSNITAGQTKEVTLSDGSTITIKDNGTMRKELSSQELADNEMGSGINLGNTLEAVWTVDTKNDVTGAKFDQAWNQPETTREYIECLHSYGINTLRIPIAWSNGDVDDGTYTIRPALLDRVETVVNYALDCGMYVIINDHWDNQWWGQFGACVKDEEGKKVADEKTRANAWVRYESYWKQIAERFQGYSDHLIFEGANEELGERLNDGICVNGPAKGYCKPDNAGKDVEVISGNLKTDELYDTVNKINKKFVDIIRESGGNNAYRHLLIPGYNTNIQNTADERFIMPKDTEENGTSKLFLSIHYYTPSDFCLDGGTGDYTTEDQAATTEYFKDLKRFTDAGYAVIMGEGGVCNPSGVTGSVTQWFYDTFKECQKYHTVPVLWDTGAYFDRTVPCINYKDIAVFFNAVNGANGSEEAERETGGDAGAVSDATIPDYLDSELWNTPGLHAYVSYQTATWDYRNAYAPLRTLANGTHSWEYIQAAGNEVTKDSTTVTDVMMNANGEYTVAIDGIDLSGANSFKMLSVSTDILVESYPDISVSNATIKIDGKEATDAPFDLVVKSDDKYYNFMLVNIYDSETTYPLGEANENEALAMPTKSIEITFSIAGLDKVLSDIEDKSYVNPETGLSLNDPGISSKIPAYLDSELWTQKALHAYLSYQCAGTWDYRNAYIPLKDLKKDEHSWEYIKASGAEVTDSTKVTDVIMTEDGDYTVAIEGFDLSGSNSFNMLSISTDISVELYPNITATIKSVKIDGKELELATTAPIIKSDHAYYDFMVINVWDKDNDASAHPLGEASANENIKLPANSVEITFSIAGLGTALADIESGAFIYPETGEALSPAPADPNATPSADPNAPVSPAPTTPASSGATSGPSVSASAGAVAGDVVGVAKGKTFTAGNYKFKVTKAATNSTKGTATLVGLTKKGKAAKKLTVADTTKIDDASYIVNALGSNAFKGAKATSITLNKKIKKIPAKAFANCKKLNKLTFKAKLTKVSKNAFTGCKKKIAVKGTSAKANKKLLKKTSYKKFK